METGCSGTVFTTGSGDTVRALAVEKPKWARWWGRTSRADQIMKSVRAAVRRAG
ncbi:hypothetical protein [Streptomyces sp. cg35]|uniref:hypothetical protein n=1 Tax=Streptomyces sp. cg35 TaxID=3421650 RepID=UPI003D17454A